MRCTRLAALLLIGGSALWVALTASQDASARKNPDTAFYFHHDHILGTSLDVWLNVPSESAAETAESAILSEIERLRMIFSLYDADSELSRLNRTREPMIVSSEMIDVLRQYEVWQERSHGAFNGQLGELVRVWKEAEATQREPDDVTLSQIVQRIRQRGWQIDEANRTVTRMTDQPLNLNAIAKGYIIQKAGEAARAKVAGLDGLLLNLGGDMFSFGHDDKSKDGWIVGVQNPHQPQDNAETIARVRLKNRAIATSGGYERYYTINGQRHSHLFDPRTGRSATGIASSTVIAADNMAANALATTLSVLTPEEGLQLIAATAGTECMLVTKEGKQFRSAGFKALEVPVVLVNPQDKKEPAKADAWPEGFQVNFSLTIPNVASKKYRRPYVAVWVEDATPFPVRTVTVWGDNPRWIKELPQWWKFAKGETALVRAVTRATRAPGKYNLIWDGKDDQGMPLPQGTYTIYVEVHREHGKLVRQAGKLVCGTEPTKITLAENAETSETKIEYAKKKTP